MVYELVWYMKILMNEKLNKKIFILVNIIYIKVNIEIRNFMGEKVRIKNNRCHYNEE